MLTAFIPFFSMQSISVPVLILRIGVEFSLSFEVSSQLRFPWDENSVNPVMLTVEVNIYDFATPRLMWC